MFAEKLRHLRNKKDLTQTKMAEIFNTAQTTYSGWEKNKEPRYEQLKEIANYFNVTIDYLLDNEKYENETNLSKLERELNKEQKKKLNEMCKVMFPEEYKKIEDSN